MSCDREFGHGVLAHPLFRKVRRDEAVENEVAVGARAVDLADEVVSINVSGSGSAKTPVAMSVIPRSHDVYL
jgi:hypothetical protein